MKVYLDINESGVVESWGSSPLHDTSIEIDINDDHPFFNDNPFQYKYVNGTLTKDAVLELEKAKENKFIELRRECENEILGYFEATVDSVVYLFSFDMEAQQNFNSTLAFFNEGLINEVEWTAHRDGKAHRIVLNKAQFLDVAIASIHHRTSKQRKLRNTLQPSLDAADSVADVEIIEW